MLNAQYPYGHNQLRKKIEDYSYGLKDVIGRGFSSVVYRGSNDKTKEKVAVKVIDIRAIQGKPEKKMLQGEIDALKKLNHPNVLKCHDIFSTANNCYIITEFCNEGDLENLLKKREKLSEEEALPIIREVLMGFIHVAENGFLHRDLKPANILLKDKTIKIADFGFAKRAGSNPKETVNVGSPLYMSPQALNGNIYTVKNDIWSIGVIIYQILHGKAPWTCSSEKQLIQEINRNSIYFLKSLSEDLKDFTRKCLAPDDKKRLSLKDLIAHPFVAKLTNEFPPLLRKLTSANENNQEVPIDNQGMNKPKILHHRQNHNSNSSPQKQFLTHLNWMRFLNKFNDLFPEISDSGRFTFGLRFIVVKQLLSQLEALQVSLNGGNPFMIEGWPEFTATEDVGKYRKSLEEYRKRFEPLGRSIKQWLPVVGKDKKLNPMVDLNLQRSQYASMMAVAFAIEQCRNIWGGLEKEKSGAADSELQSRNQSQAVRLDFTITYYQMNCFLLDNFNDSEYFGRVSRLETINEYQPAAMLVGNLKDLQFKMRSLEIVR